MALLTLVRGNNSGKLPVSMQCHNLHSLKEEARQSIPETRRTSHLFSSALFTIPLKALFIKYIFTNIHKGTQRSIVRIL